MIHRANHLSQTRLLEHSGTPPHSILQNRGKAMVSLVLPPKEEPYYIFPVISKSVFRYRKVPFYPTNIHNVSFYGKFIDIDIDAQYQEIYTDMLIFPVLYTTIFEVT